MNGEEYLRMIADSEEAICDHGDTCQVCRERREYCAAAREMLDAGSYPESISRCAAAHWQAYQERLRKLPSLN